MCDSCVPFWFCAPWEDPPGKLSQRLIQGDQSSFSLPAGNPRADGSFHKRYHPTGLAPGLRPLQTEVGKTRGWRSSGQSYWLKPHDLCLSQFLHLSCPLENPGGLEAGVPHQEREPALTNHSPAWRTSVLPPKQWGWESGPGMRLIQARKIRPAALPEVSQQPLNLDSKAKLLHCSLSCLTHAFTHGSARGLGIHWENTGIHPTLPEFAFTCVCGSWVTINTRTMDCMTCKRGQKCREENRKFGKGCKGHLDGGGGWEGHIWAET